MRIKVLSESLFIKACGLTLVPGLLLHLIGYVTQYWFKGPLKTHEFVGFSFEGHSGLWRGCDISDTFCFTPTGGASGKSRYSWADLEEGGTGGPDPPPPTEKSQKIWVPYKYWSRSQAKSQSFQAGIQCWATIGPPVKRHLNGVSLVCR